MKKYNLFLSGLMAIAFTACTNDNILPEGGHSAEKITVTAYAAGNESPSSRVEQYMDSKNKLNLEWSDGDQFSVIRGNNFTNFEKKEDEYAFEGYLPDANGTGNYFAVYPVINTSEATHTAVPFDISNQTDVFPYLMYAMSPNGLTYQFHHAVAYLKATFPADLKGKEATITITTPSGVYTDGNIDLTNGVLSGGSKSTITKQVTFGAESAEAWFALPPMDESNKTLNFLVTTSDDKYIGTLVGTSDKAIEAGKVYTATINLTEVQSSCNLPSGSTFNGSVSSFLSGKGLTKIKFIADPTWNVSGTKITNSEAYMVVNGETLEIRTNAMEFVFHSNSDYMFCGYMYYRDTNFRNLSSIDFNDCVNTAYVTTMIYMFEYCVGLTKLDLSNFNTANVANMMGMFKDCHSLTKLDLSNFNTANVTNMFQMFENCQSLTTLNLSNFNTEKVGPMDKMFYNCQRLTELDLSMFYTPLVTNMAGMFQNCYALTSLDIRNFSINHVTNFYNIFSNVGKDYYSEETDTKTLIKVNSEQLDRFNRLCGNLTYAKYVSIPSAELN